MAKNEWFRVGVIATTHGLGGEVKAYPTTEDPDRFGKGLSLRMVTGKTERMVTVERARFFKNMVIVKFREFSSIEEVEKLRQAELYVSREDALPLEEGQYYLADLMDMQVTDEEGAVLGTLTDVIETGANDVYVVSREGRKDLLIPNIPSCIREVDIENGRMKVHLLPGLEDL